ncbi:MAG: hypothetical protein IPH18_04755 [Chitinophagaceae bacterium]|nr:hypothetical protein [Chitinophagaceae bacterium]MBK8953773.1 hypothetical protein [Chitinophagaceae bacterium]
MQRVIVIVSLLVCFNSFAQDSTRTKPKEWLGVLTLTEMYQDEKNWTKDDQAVVGQHFQRLVKMKEEGIMILAGRMQLPTNDAEMKGLVIFYAKDEKEALQIMNDDPAVKAKIMMAKVYPYSVAVSRCN